MEISFKDILKIIKKNLIFIVVTALIFSVCSFFITKFFIPKTYTSSVKLYVETATDTTNSYNALSSVNYAKSLVATYIQMLQTNNFYSAVSKELNEKYSSAELSGKISFRSIEDTEVFEATVVAASPTDAKNIADAVSAAAPATIGHLNDNAELKIVDSASMPGGPSSPDVKRNILLAFAAGLFLSLIFAFFKEYFDVKIKYSEEMTSICDVPVLAAIPDFENMVTQRKDRRH